jgi:hypothetical protein
MTDGDWPAIKEAHREWLDASNFDADGQQRKSLRDMTSGLIVGRFPTVSIDIE